MDTELRLVLAGMAALADVLHTVHMNRYYHELHYNYSLIVL